MNQAIEPIVKMMKPIPVIRLPRLEAVKQAAMMVAAVAILAPLRALDEVAYLRFASVYRAFESADDFDAEIKMLRLERAAADQPATTG